MSQGRFDSLPGALAYHAQTRGQAVALRYKHLGIWQVRSWSALAADVVQLAGALRQLGFEARDRLTLISDGRVEALVLSLAAHWLGGTVSLRDPQAEDAVAESGLVFVDSLDWLTAARREGLRGARLIYADGHGLEDAAPLTLIDYRQLFDTLDPPLPANAAQPNAAAFVWDGTEPLDHRELLDAARQLIDQQGLSATDEALAGQGFFSSLQVRSLLVPWLVAGLRLNIPETPATRDQDRREVAPNLIAGTPEAYRRLQERISERAPLPGSLAYRLYAWALDDPARQGPLRRWLGYWLVRRPLRDVLGLGRVTTALLLGPDLDRPSAEFFAALGVTPQAWPLPGSRSQAPVAPSAAILIPVPA